MNSYMTDINGRPLKAGDFVRGKNGKVYEIKFGEYSLPVSCPDCGYEFELPIDEESIEHYGYYVEDKEGWIETCTKPYNWAEKLNEE